jgi:hypothetical protein
MKIKFYTIIFTLLTLIFLTTYVKANDSLKEPTINTSVDTSSVSSQIDTYSETEEDFAPGLLFTALFALGFVLVCIGAGIFLATLVLLAVFGLVMLGVLSTSIIIGLNKKSFEKGSKTFIVLTSTIGGLLIGGTGFWLLNKVVHWWTPQTSILIGAGLGFLIGIGLGFLVFIILQRLTVYFKKSLNII